MYDYELQDHKRSDSVKWILTAVAFVLILVLIGGLFYAIFHKSNSTGEITLNVDVEAYKKLTEEDFKGSKPVTLSQFMGTDESEEEEPFAYVHLISYDEKSEELVVIAASETLKLGIFVRAPHFPQSEVAKIMESKSILTDYFLGYEYEALLYGADETDDGDTISGWVNMSILWLADYLSGSVENPEEFLVPAPKVNLKFDTKGTFKPTDAVMNAIIGKETKKSEVQTNEG